jgi:NADPH:quinone reductase-like Zn-dependent oxidoreductase
MGQYRSRQAVGATARCLAKLDKTDQVYEQANIGKGAAKLIALMITHPLDFFQRPEMTQTLPQTMQAARITAYGAPQVIEFATRPVPRPKAGEVLVRVHAAPVTAGDARLRSGDVPRGMGLLLRIAIGWRKPRVAPGLTFSGEVVALGAGVTSLAMGQRVFGMKGFKGGAHAEYLTMNAAGMILPLPDSLSHEQGAAFFFGGMTAAEFLLDKAQVKAGERVLIAGATGAVGSAAVQIAAHVGAQVTAAASAQNLDLARQLGAITALDYRAGPVQGHFDVIVDVMGTYLWVGAKPLLSSTGRLCLITADLGALLGAALRPRRAGRRVIGGKVVETRAKMQNLITLHLAGAYTPVLGDVLPFAQLPRAHAIADSFHKVGNLVVVMT